MTGISSGTSHETASVRVINSTTCTGAIPTGDVTSQQTAPDGNGRRGWASVGAVALGAFVIVMTETLPVGLLPQIADGLGIALGPAGLIVLVPGFAAAVAAPLFYRGSSSFNRRTLILVLGLTVLVSNAVVAIAPGFALVLVARMLFGATLGAFWTIVSPVGPRLVGKAGGTRAISIVAAGISGGTVVGLPAGQFLGNLVGWRYTFAIAAAATLLIVAAQAIVLPSIPPPAQRTRLTDLGRVIARPATRFGMAAGALAFIGQFTAWTYITPFLADHTQLSSGAISVLYVLYGVAGIVGSVIAGSLFNRGVVPSFAGAAIAVAVLVIVLAFTGTMPWSAAVLLVLWGGFWGIVNPGTLVWILHSSPAEDQEAASAVNVTNLQIALAIGSGLGATLVSLTALQTLFIASGAIVLASGVLAATSTRFVRVDPPK
ncbi:MFS transporter [Nonomuraea phyllanthi]|uniref:MFS transporter n=1 Tax=Nonomuraea phyllanthi TaxID=2219224 RepID=A0A5C4VCW6_9ACTN|nr:MFS transporter [Nonomuraea phyllanthi]